MNPKEQRIMAAIFAAAAIYLFGSSAESVGERA